MPRTGDVTAVMCTRNGLSRGYLNEALKSVQEQTTAPSEFLLVDDGSSDGTTSEVRRAYPGVRVLSNAGTGLAAARNTGINAARSTWIAFIDDDDVWCPTKLSEQLAQIAGAVRPESTFWASRMAIIGEGGGAPVPRSPLTQFASWPACLLKSSASPSGVLFSRELFRRVGPFNECIRSGAFYEFWVRSLAAGATVRYSENILLHYRRHPTQMTPLTRLPDLYRITDTLLLPYLDMLPQTLATRFRTAHILKALLILALRNGVPSAARFWADTQLRPVRLDLRTCAYFVLDLTASKAPPVAERLWKVAVRLLLKDFQCGFLVK